MGTDDRRGKLRSAATYGKLDRDGFIHRSWMKAEGLPGDVFDENYVANFIAHAENAGPVLMRSLAGLKVVYDVRAYPQSHQVDVLIRFE